jgi:hypothetical protein
MEREWTRPLKIMTKMSPVRGMERRSYERRIMFCWVRNNGMERIALTISESFPPPFKPWSEYYLLPKSFHAALQSAALSDEANSTSTRVDLDITELLESTEGETVFTPGYVDEGGKSTITATPIKQVIWQLKQGLMEDEDFMFISANGWNELEKA